MGRTSGRLIWPLLALFAAGASLAACGGERGDSGDGVRKLHAESLSAYPHEQLVDWVTYADAVVVARVVGESEIPATPDEVKAGEGLTMRNVDVEVTETVWQSDRSAPPSKLSFVTGGWMFSKDERKPVQMSDAERLAVGETYLMPVALVGEQRWAPIGQAETMQWVDRRAVAGPDQQRKGLAAEGRSVNQLDGLGAAEIGKVLARVEPDPLAAKFADLPPSERYAAILEARRAGD